MEDFVIVPMVWLFLIGGLVVLILYRRAADRERLQRKREETQRWLAHQDRRQACLRVLDALYETHRYVFEEFVSLEEAIELVEDGWTAEEILDWINDRVAEESALVLGYQPLDEGAKFNVCLSRPARERHTYIIGKTGSGKTNLIRTLVMQDLERGDGIGVIAPEQEMLTEEILPYIPDHRIDDVIYFNPADMERPVPFNPLHLDEDEDIDLRADEIFTIFQRIMGEGGHRMDQILRYAVYALLERPGTTLLDVPRLLDPNDSSFREAVVRESGDPETAHFFREVYPQFPKDAYLPIANRLGRFTRPKTIRNVLCQPGDSLSFRRAMDSGKIMLFNFSDGILGETNSAILGQLVVSKFQLATSSRADQPKQERRNFWLYIDEFQTFVGVAAASYEKILSRARKYKLGLILAHQTTSQIPLNLLREILGNVGCVVSFVVSHDDANRLSKEFLIRREGELTHVSPDELLNLNVGESFCKIGKSTTFMRTYLADQRPDDARAERIIERSRQNYGITPMPERQEKEPAVATKTSGERRQKKRVLDGFDPTRPFDA